MVPFVEYDVLRQIAFRALAGLVEHQSMVGDNQAGVARVADVLFNPAFAVVRAARIEAFAALVGQVCRDLGSKQVDQPGRKIPPDHVAAAAAFRPARCDDKPDAFPIRQPPGLTCFLQIKQAKVVFSPFAHHHGAILGAGLFEQAVHFLIDLALQGAGVG